MIWEHRFLAKVPVLNQHMVVAEIIAAGGVAVANGASVANWIQPSPSSPRQSTISGGSMVWSTTPASCATGIFTTWTRKNGNWSLMSILTAAFTSRERLPRCSVLRNSGAYVHMVSTSGLIGNFGQANYSAAKLGLAALSKSIAMDMSRFNVRSNCISPFAFSRMIGSIPTETEEQQARVERLKVMEPAKVAPLAAYLASDAAQDVSGQIFAVRANEIFLMSQIRPLRAMQTSEGWTAETIASRAMPAFKGSFYPLDRSQDVFNWDPV